MKPVKSILWCFFFGVGGGGMIKKFRGDETLYKNPLWFFSCMGPGGGAGKKRNNCGGQMWLNPVNREEVSGVYFGSAVS